MTNPTYNDPIRVRVEEIERPRLHIDEADVDAHTPLRVEIDDNPTYNALVHLSALLAVWAGGMAFLGPLILWLLLRNDHPTIEPHAKEAINFQITLCLQAIIGSFIAFFLFWIPVFGWILLIPLFIYFAILAIIGLIAPIIAALRASDGRFYRYPLTWRILK